MGSLTMPVPNNIRNQTLDKYIHASDTGWTEWMEPQRTEGKKWLSVSHHSKRRRRRGKKCINVGLKDHPRSGADGVSWLVLLKSHPCALSSTRSSLRSSAVWCAVIQFRPLSSSLWSSPALPDIPTQSHSAPICLYLCIFPALPTCCPARFLFLLPLRHLSH